VYGHRARIGYTSVAFVTEVFPYSFYRMAPEGVTLALVTVQQSEFSKGEMARLYEDTMAGARTLARSGVDLVVLGGRPVLLSRGEKLEEIEGRLSSELGVPVTTDASAQLAAFRALGAKRVATVHPFAAHHDDRHDKMISQLGLEPAGSLGGGCDLVGLPRIPVSQAAEWGREMQRRSPHADTLLFPCPHWAVVEAIDPLEAELRVNVVTNLQATLWHSLRLCGIRDSVPGYGRLLRDF
jgi:maleate isomerase